MTYKGRGETSLNEREYVEAADPADAVREFNAKRRARIAPDERYEITCGGVTQRAVTAPERPTADADTLVLAIAEARA